jgi:ribosomal protein L16 Arg81 hydroxylase
MKKLNTADAHLYINITIKGNTYGNHCDNVDVYFCQCQGQTK